MLDSDEFAHPCRNEGWEVCLPRFGGSGEVVATFPTLAEAQEFIKDPPESLVTAVLFIYDRGGAV